MANVKKYLLLVSSGCTGILRAYVATASKLEERHRAIAQATGAYSLGLTAGPSNSGLLCCKMFYTVRLVDVYSHSSCTLSDRISSCSLK